MEFRQKGAHLGVPGGAQYVGDCAEINPKDLLGHTQQLLCQ